MKNKLQKKIIFNLSLVFLLVIVFSCQFGIWDSFMAMINNHSNMLESVADCCQANSSGLVPTSNDSNKSIFTLPDNRLYFMNIFFVILYLLIIFLLRLTKSIIFDYLKTIRIKYGGFKLFYYFSSLFSAGIINPKIY